MSLLSKLPLPVDVQEKIIGFLDIDTRRSLDIIRPLVISDEHRALLMAIPLPLDTNFIDHDHRCYVVTLRLGPGPLYSFTMLFNTRYHNDFIIYINTKDKTLYCGKYRKGITSKFVEL
jgi:hypothetical protein